MDCLRVLIGHVYAYSHHKLHRNWEQILEAKLGFWDNGGYPFVTNLGQAWGTEVTSLLRPILEEKQWYVCEMQTTSIGTSVAQRWSWQVSCGSEAQVHCMRTRSGSLVCWRRMKTSAMSNDSSAQAVIAFLWWKQSDPNYVVECGLRLSMFSFFYLVILHMTARLVWQH